jgi:hypothetical protein
VRVMEKTSTGFCWGSRAVIPLEVTKTVSAGGPIFCFVVGSHPAPGISAGPWPPETPTIACTGGLALAVIC